MYEIQLELIKPSSNQIRKSWDEQKMQELAQSIKEQGVIVPIKVRPINGDLPTCSYHGLSWLEEAQINPETEEPCFWCNEYRGKRDIYSDWEREMDDDERGYPTPIMEIVYGHRRVEAVRQCGWNTISAIVDPVSSLESLIQAVVENIQREDMNPVDIGEALVDLKSRVKNNSNDAIAKIVGVSTNRVRYWCNLTTETDTTKSLIGTHVGGAKVTHKKIRHAVPQLIMSNDAQPITETHVRATREAGVKTPEERETILVKASEEGLTYRETKEVAHAYKAAEGLPNAEVLQKEILSMPVKGKSARHILNVAEVDARAKQRDTSFRDLIEEQEAEEKEFTYQEKEYDALVADYLRMVKELGEAIRAVSDGIEYGKFDRIAAQFTINKNIELIGKLDNLNGELRNVR